MGATGLAVGLVAGLGELIGYGLRLLSGAVADRTSRYWLITWIGYAVNLLAVPLLATAGAWQIAAALIIAERVGKAIRTPARDAMLSQAANEVGHGWGFGVHEALDQCGAVLGPLVIAAVLTAGHGYRAGFAVLLLPALLALGTLAVAWRNDSGFAAHASTSTGPEFDRPIFSLAFWIYLAAAAAIAAGYADFALIAFHLGKRAIISSQWIPILYAVAMAVNALAALTFGRLFDRFGGAVLIASILISAPFAILCIGDHLVGIAVGMLLWGIGMGAQESVLRAMIATLVPAGRRATGYGFFNAAYGLAWFLGSALMGFLYDVSPIGLVAFSVLAQLAAIPLLFVASRRPRNAS